MKKKILIIALLFITTFKIREINADLVENINPEEYFSGCEPTVDVVRYFLSYYNVKHSEIVLRQSILETGWFKSSHCKKHKNLFGFYRNGKICRYSSFIQSIKDYKRFQDRKYKGGCYYSFLNKVGYAENENYNFLLKKIKVKENNNKI